MFGKILFVSAVCLSAAAGIGGEERPSDFAYEFIRHCAACSEPKAGDPDPGMAGRNFRWSFEGKYSVVYAGNTFFSFRTEELAYRGGAHGILTVRVGSLRRGDGRRIRLAGIAPDARSREKLLALIVAATAERFRCAAGELPEKLLRMPRLTENFYLDGRGISFVYNEYEIASKGTGPIEVTVPWARYPEGKQQGESLWRTAAKK